MLEGPKELALLTLLDWVLIPAEAGAFVEADALLVPEDYWIPP